MEARQRRGIMRMVDKVSGEDSSVKSWWRRCRITGMDTAAEEMRDGNKGDVV